ncbi:MAG: DsbA family protein [Rhodospirillales bacterium]
MIKHRFPGLILIIGLLLGAPTQAADTKTPLDKQAVEKILRDILRENPEIVVEAIETYRAKQEAAKQEKARETLAAKREELENGPLLPIGGNPKGTVTIVEFFDYQCGYCKRVLPSVLSLLESDKTIKYVFTEFPILGPASLLASQAALAVWKMDKSKYVPFHTALMSSRGGLNQDKIMRLARETGIDSVSLQAHMQDPGIQKTLQKNIELAQALNINGTPAFIIGDQIVPGAVELDDLKRLVEASRKN